MKPVSRARPPASRAVIVLGMHRSGTSALAGGLHILGVHLGDNLMPATPFNPEGYFEHADVVAHHERVLHALGSRWDDLRPLPPRWWGQSAPAALEGELRELIKREFGAARLWAVKDPRMCRLLPAWRRPLRSLGVPLRFVLVARDPREVARSLAERDGFPAWKAHLLYLDHLLAAERATRYRPRVFVTYDELLGDGPAAFERIGAELDLDWSARVQAESARLRAFLHPRLRHHAAAGDAGGSRLERTTAECYAAFAAAAQGHQAQLPAALEPIATLVHDVVLPWARGMAEDAQASLADAERQVRASRRSIDLLVREVEEARLAHGLRDADDATVREARRAQDAEIKQARANIEALVAEIEVARRAHQDRDQIESALRTGLHAREAEVDQARVNIDALTAEIEVARRAHQDRDRTESSLREALRARDAEVDRARAKIEALVAEIEVARRAHEDRDQAESALLEALRAREADVERARVQIDGLIAEMAAARRLHHALAADNEQTRRNDQAQERREADLRAALAHAQEQIGPSRHAQHVLAHEVEIARRELEERSAAEAELRSALGAARAELENRAREEARLRADLNEQLSRAHELEVSLLESEHELGDLKRSLVARRSWWDRTSRAAADSPGPVAAVPVLFGLDALPAEVDGSDLRLSGWHVPSDGQSLRRMVVRAGKHRFEGAHGRARPDVERAHPSLSGAGASGFAVTLRLPPGDHRVLFEAEYGDGTWRSLAARELRVRRAPLTAVFDAPAPPWRVESGPVRFAGWCAHPQDRVRRLTLLAGGRTVECTYGHLRPDAEAAFPWAGRSGFDATVTLPPGRTRVTLRAQLDSGDVVVHTASQALVVIPAAVSRVLRRLQPVARSAVVWREVAAHLRRRIRDGRPSPPLHALPRRLAELVRLHRMRVRSVQDRPAPPVVIGQRSSPYASWLRVNAWNDRALANLELRLAAQEVLPRISVVSSMGGDALDGLLASLQAQVHADWELCLTDPAAHTRRDHRVRAAAPAAGGMAGALNAAVEHATGEFLILARAPLALGPNALAELALFAAEHPESDVVYCDHDALNEAGERGGPWLKPGWSPELLLSCMYFGPAWMVRRSLFQAVGGLREDFAGVDDHDLALRASERARRVGHVPLVLFHDRRRDEEKPQPRAAAGAVREALQRRGGRTASTSVAYGGTGGVALTPPADSAPSVALVVLPAPDEIVASDERERWRASTYAPLEVVVAERGSRGATDAPASRAAMANDAARAVTADYLLFVEAGAVPRDPSWVSGLMGWARLPGVGAVGARIVRPEGGVQHDGVIHAMQRGRRRPGLLQDPDDSALPYGRLPANRTAVSGACLLTARSLFLESGGFDAGAFAEVYHDLDYCYRLAQWGYRCVSVPEVQVELRRDLAAALRTHPQAEACFLRKHAGHDDELVSPYLVLEHGRLELKPRRLSRGGKRPIRALMCAFNLNREGAPHSQFELTARLKRCGVLDPVVFSPAGGPLGQAYDDEGIEVQVGPHPLAGVFDETGYERAIASFADFVRAQGVELVYGNTVHTFYAIAAAEVLGLPSIWNPRESERFDAHFAHFGPAVAARALECFRHPYRVVFVAEATRQVYAPLESSANFTVVHNGLDRRRLEGQAERWPREAARRSLDLGDEEIALLLLGTVCERKGQVDLPLALADLPERWWPRVRCLIVGDRELPYSQSVHAAREALPPALRERVAILPETDDAARFYRAADVFVCTSRIESFPRVILEAMAHGLPVVTTPAFGIREQVREGVNALFYEPGDTAGLGRALLTLLEDEPLRRAMAAHARPVLECLNDFETMTEAYAEIFREAYLSKGRPVATAQVD